MIIRFVTAAFSLTCLLSLLVNSSLMAAGILETWESQGTTDPFTGTGDLTWLGDVGDFEITSATWPFGAGQPPDFAGSRSLRSRDTGGTTSTIVTPFAIADLSNAGVNWRVYVNGNSAEINTVRDFAFLLTSDTSDVSDIEAGTMNGYRLFVGDDTSALDPADVVQLQVATGAGWSSISSESIAGGANINDDWQLEVRLRSAGAWSWGFENGVAIDSAVTLNNSVANIDVTSSLFAGMMWRSSNTDDNDFGFDNFSISKVPEPTALAFSAIALLALGGFGWPRRCRRR